MTNDMQRRLEEHETGTGKDTAYTYSRRPLKLVYTEPFQYAEDAIKREKQIKKWSRAKKEALIAGNISQLKNMSRCLNLTRHSNYEYDRGLVVSRPAFDSTEFEHSEWPAHREEKVTIHAEQNRASYAGVILTEVTAETFTFKTVKQRTKFSCMNYFYWVLKKRTDYLLMTLPRWHGELG